MYRESFENNSRSRNSAKSRGKSSPQPGNSRNAPRTSGYKPSTLDPQLFIRKAQSLESTEYVSARRIQDLPVHEGLRKCLTAKGYERPTEIQDRTLETLLQGRDLLGIAQTGTGKTAAFMVPIINQLLQHKRHNYALVLLPTRELAVQVDDEFRSMVKGLGLWSQCFIGGTNINTDLSRLGKPSHVIIATPGRLLDLVARKALDLNNIHTLVIDEFDRMLDMGFVHDVKRIIAMIRERKHTMLFSATLDPTQESLIRDILRNPEVVKVSSGETTGDHIDQEIVRVKAGQDKFDILVDMIREPGFSKVLVFEETKHLVNKLSKKLTAAGVNSSVIHGNKSQNARQQALDGFKNGKVQVLVATDVAARGIDVSDITHVINYQVPLSFDRYIHRIGRTGRAGRTGKAYTFVS